MEKLNVDTNLETRLSAGGFADGSLDGQGNLLWQGLALPVIQKGNDQTSFAGHLLPQRNSREDCNKTEG